MKNSLKIVSNSKYVDEHFEEFYFLPQQDGAIDLLENIEIKNCQANYSGIIAIGFRVKNLTIENLKCGGVLKIHSEVPLEKVKISGKFPKSLRIEPFEDGQYNHPNYSLDISEYRGEVEIIGVDTQRIKIDPSLHVKICLEQHNQIDLGSLPPFNIVRIMIEKLSLSSARQGVFQIYDEYKLDYEEAIEKGLPISL